MKRAIPSPPYCKSLVRFTSIKEREQNTLQVKFHFKAKIIFFYSLWENTLFFPWCDLFSFEFCEHFPWTFSRESFSANVFPRTFFWERFSENGFPRTFFREHFSEKVFHERTFSGRLDLNIIKNSLFHHCGGGRVVRVAVHFRMIGDRFPTARFFMIWGDVSKLVVGGSYFVLSYPKPPLTPSKTYVLIDLPWEEM